MNYSNASYEHPHWVCTCPGEQAFQERTDSWHAIAPLGECPYCHLTRSQAVAIKETA